MKVVNGGKITIKKFQRKIWGYYCRHKRILPWRWEKDPYRIAVSEFMLQQTQVARVLIKYKPFIETFPDFSALARAPLAAVLRRWQGLGYNRRAVALKRMSEMVIKEYRGRLPKELKLLLELPGIGPATAGAISAFAFNQPEVFLETNIRRVLIHEFFPGKKAIADELLIDVLTQALDYRRPREWYYALMDYGAMLGRRPDNANRRSARYRRQAAFAGSNRELRGKIIRLALARPSFSLKRLAAAAGASPRRVADVVQKLKAEGFVILKGIK